MSDSKSKYELELEARQAAAALDELETEEMCGRDVDPAVMAAAEDRYAKAVAAAHPNVWVG